MYHQIRQIAAYVVGDRSGARCPPKPLGTKVDQAGVTSRKHTKRFFPKRPTSMLVREGSDQLFDALIGKSVQLALPRKIHSTASAIFTKKCECPRVPRASRRYSRKLCPLPTISALPQSESGKPCEKHYHSPNGRVCYQNRNPAAPSCGATLSSDPRLVSTPLRNASFVPLPSVLKFPF